MVHFFLPTPERIRASSTAARLFGGSLSGLVRPTRRLLLLPVGWLIAASMLPSCARLETGEQAIQREQEAMKHATSWKMKNVSPLGGGHYIIESLDEYSCPSKRRLTWHYQSVPEDPPDSFTTTILSIDGQEYSSMSKRPNWTKGGGHSWDPARMCDAMAKGREYNGIPPLAQWLGGNKQHPIIKGEVQETPAGRCQDWYRVAPSSPGVDEHVCLGVEDYLPRLYTVNLTRPFSVQFLDWNQPNDFPVPAVQQPASPNTRP